MSIDIFMRKASPETCPKCQGRGTILPDVYEDNSIQFKEGVAGTTVTGNLSSAISKAMAAVSGINDVYYPKLLAGKTGKQTYELLKKTRLELSKSRRHQREADFIHGLEAWAKMRPDEIWGWN